MVPLGNGQCPACDYSISCGSKIDLFKVQENRCLFSKTRFSSTLSILYMGVRGAPK